MAQNTTWEYEEKDQQWNITCAVCKTKFPWKPDEPVQVAAIAALKDKNILKSDWSKLRMISI